MESCWKVSQGTQRSGLVVGAIKPHLQPALNSWKPEDVILAKKLQEQAPPFP